MIAAWKGVRETPNMQICMGCALHQRAVPRLQGRVREAGLDQELDERQRRPGAMPVVDPVSDPSCPMLRRETSMTASGRRPPHGPTTRPPRAGDPPGWSPWDACGLGSPCARPACGVPKGQCWDLSLPLHHEQY